MAYFDNIALLVSEVSLGGTTATIPGKYVIKVMTYYKDGENFVAFGEIPIVIQKNDALTLGAIKLEAIEAAKDILGNNYPISVIDDF